MNLDAMQVSQSIVQSRSSASLCIAVVPLLPGSLERLQAPDLTRSLALEPRVVTSSGSEHM
jgi:hypothetical protein